MGPTMRFVILLSVCAAAAFLGGLYGGQTPASAQTDDPGVISAQKIQILDENNQPAIVLTGRQEEGRGLFITNPEGDLTIALGLRDGRPGLMLQQSEGRAAFIGFAENGPRVEFFENGKLRAFYGVYKKDLTPALTLFDDQGTPRAMLAMGEEPQLTFAKADGSLALQIPR